MTRKKKRLSVGGGSAGAKQCAQVEEQVSDFNGRHQFAAQHLGECLVDDSNRFGNDRFAGVKHVELLSKCGDGTRGTGSARFPHRTDGAHQKVDTLLHRMNNSGDACHKV